jgi:hypothetical protein
MHFQKKNKKKKKVLIAIDVEDRVENTSYLKGKIICTAF